MPNMDGTGPAGKGPKSGSQMGRCEGAEPICRGWGRRRGAGRGMPRRVTEEEKKAE